MSAAFGGFSSRRKLAQNGKNGDVQVASSTSSAEPAAAGSKAFARARAGGGGGGGSNVKATAKPSSKQLEAELLRRSDDLTAKMRVWAYQANAQYGREESAAAQMTVTIEAIVGGQLLREPFWVAAVSGSVEETGTSTPQAQPFAGGVEVKDAPSWSSEPISLAVHDLASDLLLFLCESEGTDATNACVGRAILPLTEFLPVNPFATHTVSRQLWVDIMPPAPEYANGAHVHTSYAAHCPRVMLSGMAKVPPAERSRALITVSLALQRSPLGAYLWVPPFNGLVEHPGSDRHERPHMPPERIVLVADRLNCLLASEWTPAMFILARTRPWSVGGSLVAMMYWLCFYGSLGMLPVWLAILYLINTFSFQALGHETTSPWEADAAASSDGAPAPSDHAVHNHAQHSAASLGGLSAEEKLKRLEDALLPIIKSAEALASTIERIKGGPFSGDPRASFLAALPLLLFGGMACAACYLVSAFIIITGGVNFAFFDATCIWCLINLATYHHREIKECFGNGREEDDAEAVLVRQARQNPFAGPGANSLARREANTPYADEAGSLDDDAQWLVSEDQAYLTEGIGWLWYNVWLRLPDAPTQVHRAIAREAARPADDAEEQCCS